MNGSNACIGLSNGVRPDALPEDKLAYTGASDVFPGLKQGPT